MSSFLPARSGIWLPAALLLLVQLDLACRPPEAPVVTVTSHSDGQRVFGLRTINVAGTVDNGADLSAVTLTVNGGPAIDATLDGSNFTAAVELADNANTLEITATTEGSLSGSATLALTYPFLRLTSFQPASLVVGQPDFTSTGSGAASELNFGTLYGDPDFGGGNLYLPDYGRDRVLGYVGIPTANGAAASFVLGQPDLTTTGGQATATGLDGPQTIQVYENKLTISDYGNNRIAIWNTLPQTNAAPMDVAVGQPDLVTNDSACAATGLNGPESHFIVNGKLIVGDSGNNRVLIWNTLPTASGATPDLVLGQGDFTHCQQNDDNQDTAADGAATGRTMYYPSGIWSDGTRLVVADASNNRVLIWNTFPTTSFQPADLVLGQGGLDKYDSNDDNQDGVTDALPTARTLAFPYFIASNGNQLFIADDSNNRVLIWNAFPSASFQPADGVLGQADFDSATANDDNQDGVSDANPTARTLSDPTGIRLIEGGLWVGEDNNRFLVYRP